MSGKQAKRLRRAVYRYTAEEWELKKELEREESSELADSSKLEEEFCTALRTVGMKEESIQRLAATGPGRILSQIEAGTIRFASPKHAEAVEKAVNEWGKNLWG